MYSDINIENIESISVIKFEKLPKEEMKKTTKILDTEPNIHIRFKNKMTVIAVFGIREQVDQMYIFVDKPHDFQSESQKLMDNQSQN